MDLDEAVHLLYGQHPDAFLSARRRLAQGARAEGDVGLGKAIDSVRKPTVAAWAVNLLARDRAGDVDRLLELSTSLHDAQDRMDGAALKDLGRARSTLVDELVRACSDVVTTVGGSLSGSVANQIRETFVAALASTSAADAVASGQLTRALSYAGFGDVDLSEATAAPSPARRPALRVVPGGRDDGRDDGHADRAEAAESPKTAPTTEPSADDEPDEPDEDPPRATRRAPRPAPGPAPDPVRQERLGAARARARETRAAAKAADAELTRTTESVAALDKRTADLETALRQARSERDNLVGARADATAAKKAADRTLRASLAELDQARSAVPEQDDPGDEGPDG